MTEALAIVRLLPMSDHGKDVEVLALHRRIAVPERQLNGQRVRFEASDRAFPAALPHRMPMHTLHRMRLLIRPGTVLRRHRDLIARRHATRSRPERGCRPRTVGLASLTHRQMAEAAATPGFDCADFTLADPDGGG